MSELSAALVAAVAELQSIPKSRTATVPTKSGGSYSYDYADLGDSLDVVRPVLAKYRLAVLQPVETVDGRTGVSTMILHASGEQMVFGPLFMPAGDGSPQAIGSSITYARRYSLLSALGLATEDDDASAAQGAGSAAPRQQSQQRSRARKASGPTSPAAEAATAHAQATNNADVPPHVAAVMDEFGKTKGAMVVEARHHDQGVKTVGDITLDVLTKITETFRTKAAAAASS